MDEKPSRSPDRLALRRTSDAFRAVASEDEAFASRTAVPALWPFLVACAAVALWVDFGTLHRDQHSDSILNVLISLYRWTPFVWEQDRFGMAVPLLAVPIKHPLANLLFQSFSSTFAGLATFFLLARFAFRSRAYPAVATIGAASLLALTPPYYRFEYLVDTSYGIGLSLALAGLMLIEAGPRGGSWPRLVGACLLIGLANWVNSATSLFLGPFVLLQGLGKAGPGLRRLLLLLGRAGLSTLGRLEGLANLLRRDETPRSLIVLSVGYSTGQALMNLSPDRPTDLSALPPGEWAHSWSELIRVSWSALDPPLWLVPMVIAAALAGWGLARPGPARPDRAGRSAAALIATSLALWLLMGTRSWVKINDYEFRYLLPSALFGQAAVIGLAVDVLVGKVPSWPRFRAAQAPIAGVVLLASATSSYGLPSLAGVRRDLDRKCGALTDDLLAARCTCLAGDYWKVWVAVFHANLVLHERGEARTLWGLTFRSSPTYAVWKRVPMGQRMVAIPKGDGLGEVWLRTYQFPELREVEVRRTIRVLEPIPRRDPPRAPPGGARPAPAVSAPGQFESDDQPERAVASGCLVGGQGEAGEGEDLRRVGHPAVDRVVAHLQEASQPLVLERQRPAGRQLGELGPEPVEAGAAERPAGRERQRDGPDLRGEVDPSALGAQGQQVRQGRFAQLGGGPGLEPGPAGVDRPAEVVGGRPFPVPFGAEGEVEDLGDLGGEPALEGPLGPPDGERQSHGTPLPSPPEGGPRAGGPPGLGGSRNVLGLGSKIAGRRDGRRLGSGFARSGGVFS